MLVTINQNGPRYWSHPLIPLAFHGLRQRNAEFDNLDDDTETVVTDEGTASIDDNPESDTEPS